MGCGWYAYQICDWLHKHRRYYNAVRSTSESATVVKGGNMAFDKKKFEKEDKKQDAKLIKKMTKKSDKKDKKKK
jgi:hypothetical protein